MLKVLGAAMALLVSGCASYITPPPRTNVVIAVTGFDDAMRDRFSREVPDGWDDIGLSLNFSTKIPAEQCAGRMPKEVKPANVINFKIGAVIPPGGAGGTEVLVMNGQNGPEWQGQQLAPGRYTLRDGGLSWADLIHFSSGESNMAMANSEASSLSFNYDGGPTFAGFYRMSLTARDEIVLTKQEPSPGVLAAVADRMGLATAPVAAATGVAAIRHCREGIHRSGVRS